MEACATLVNKADVDSHPEYYRFKTASGMEACATAENIRRENVEFAEHGFKTASGMEACATNGKMFRFGLFCQGQFQNRKRYGSMRDRLQFS